MILAKGKLYDTEEQGVILAGLEAEINETLATQSLNPEIVIAALDTLGKRIEEGAFDKLIASLEIEGTQELVNQVVKGLRKESLAYRLAIELGDTFFERFITKPPYDQPGITSYPMPLGVLLHIAAGNVDGLPAFSVVEGLITGNINLLKLPQADKGLTIEILRILIEIEPLLAEYIYVFDTPSSDVPAIKCMAQLVDGIVVWGSDLAVSAVRTMAPVGTKLIEWGEKLGFAYVSGYEDKEKELQHLAEHISVTKQLLCSSCQVIYLNTDSDEELEQFAQEFLGYLETACQKYPILNRGIMAEITLRNYNNRIEEALGRSNGSEKRTLYGEGCSVTIGGDSILELSNLFGNCFVKKLPKQHLLPTLRRHKGHLQTVGLICMPEIRVELTQLLAKSGVNRIMHPESMSATFIGEAHDGQYPLRRYVRIVNQE